MRNEPKDARNTLQFSQALSISVPVNPDMRVGQMIEVKLPV